MRREGKHISANTERLLRKWGASTHDSIPERIGDTARGVVDTSKDVLPFVGREILKTGVVTVLGIVSIFGSLVNGLAGDKRGRYCRTCGQPLSKRRR
jgi:hypothetical protein